MRNFPIQTGLAMASAGALLAAAGLVWPAVKGPRGELFEAIGEIALPAPPAAPGATPAITRPRIVAPAVLLDDSAGALDHFYESLWRTEKQQDGAVTRIAHYGDSPTTGDLITGDIRKQLQARFGDAGHGFVLIAKPWAWYQHRGVSIDGSQWEMAPASHFKKLDGLFGFGGVSFTGESGAYSRIELSDPGQTRLELWYLEQPGGGIITATVAGHLAARIETRGDTRRPGFAPFHAEGGAHEIELRVEQGTVRLFGLTAEKPGPGVVYDSLGLNGASIRVMTHMFNQDHWTDELRRRNPNLVVINYGTNEADFAEFIDSGYNWELREAVRRVRAALPEASILLMSPMDRGEQDGADIKTMATIPRIVAIQRRVARETGCGFFDTFDAMGGEGTMARWYTGEPRLVSADLIHPSPAGGKIIATIFVKELAAGLNRYKGRRLQGTK